MKREHDSDISKESESPHSRDSSLSHRVENPGADEKPSNKRRKSIGSEPTSLGALDNAKLRGKLLRTLQEARAEQAESAQPPPPECKDEEKSDRAGSREKPPKRVSFADEAEIRVFSPPSPSPSPSASETDESPLSSPSWETDEDDEDADALVEESFTKDKGRDLAKR